MHDLTQQEYQKIKNAGFFNKPTNKINLKEEKAQSDKIRSISGNIIIDNNEILKKKSLKICQLQHYISLNMTNKQLTPTVWNRVSLFFQLLCC